MVLSGIRGALGFLSRLPVGHDQEAWDTLRGQPATFPAVGYLLGAIFLLPLLLPVPAATAAVLFVLVIYAVTGINHLDGVTDLGDAVVVHGDSADRREVMKDTTVGVGGAFALVVVVFGLGAAGFQLAQLPVAALGLVVATEVAAKGGMAVLICLGSAAHDGLGAQFTEANSREGIVSVGLLILPALALTWPALVPLVATIRSALLVALVLLWWANTALGGVSGDVFGAANEIARLVGLHVGVIVWMHC